MVLAALLAAGCKDERRSRDRAQAPQPPPIDALANSTTGPGPRWSVTIPGTPGVRLVEGASGPVLAGENDIAVVASSVFGFAGVRVDSGKVAWQVRGETRPGPIMKRGSELWLAGRCDGVDGAPTAADRLLVGCVTVVEPTTGKLMRRLWVTVPRSLSTGRIGSPSGALGMSAAGTLFWFTGQDVWQIDTKTGSATTVCGTKSTNAPPIRGAFIQGDAIFMLWTDSVARCDFAKGRRGRVEPTWTRPLPEPVAGATAGPVVVGDQMIWVRDEVLESRRVDGTASWTAKGRFAGCPSCLQVAGNQLEVVKLDAGVVAGRAILALAKVDPRTGRATAEPSTLSAPQVLATLDGVIVLREDTSLRNDAVHVIGVDGAGGFSWRLPPPVARRVAPVGLAPAAGGALVFFDGRHLVRLPVGARATAP